MPAEAPTKFFRQKRQAPEHPMFWQRFRAGLALDALRDPKQNTGDQNPGCRPGPYRVFPTKRWTPGRPVFRRRSGAERSQPAPPFSALPRAHGFVCHLPHHPGRRHRWRRPDRTNGPARACRPRLRRRRPDTTAVVDVLPRIDRPGEPLVVPHPYPVGDPLGRSGRDGVGAGFTGTRPIPSKSVGRDKPQYPVTKSTCFRHGARGSVLAVPAGDEAA